MTQHTALRLMDPVTDLDLVHRWVTEPRAHFWGMTGKSPEEVGEIYTWLQEQEHLAAYVLEVDGTPVGIFQTYDPAVDEIGTFYEREAGDLGVHLLLADTPARAGHSAALLTMLVRWCFAQAGVERIVVEPDADNGRSLMTFGRAGLTAGPRVQLPGKVAQFAFLRRADAAALSVGCPAGVAG